MEGNVYQLGVVTSLEYESCEKHSPNELTFRRPHFNDFLGTPK